MKKSIAPAPPPPEPPDGLSEASQTLWRAVVPSRALSPGRLALIETALQARDRAAEAREAIDQEGMLLAGAGKIRHANPLLKVEKDSLALFQRCWAQLGLHWDQQIDGNLRPNSWRL